MVTSDNGTIVPTGLKTTFRVVATFGGGALSQNISNLFTTSVSTADSEFASTSLNAVTALAVPKGDPTVVATIAGLKPTIAESVTREFPITIVDSKSLSSLTIDGVPATIPANGEPFTPTFKGTYGTVEFNTTSPTLSFKATSADDKAKYVEIISGAVYPRLPGTVSIIGTVNVPVDGQADPRKVTVSSDVQIVDAALAGVTLAPAEMGTDTVGVDKTIRFTATADYGTVQQPVTTAVIWVSADPNIAMVSNAAGTFGAPGTVTGVSPGGPVDIQAYYRGKLVGTTRVTVIP
jgi:hypothetical protein